MESTYLSMSIDLYKKQVEYYTKLINETQKKIDAQKMIDDTQKRIDDTQKRIDNTQKRIDNTPENVQHAYTFEIPPCLNSEPSHFVKTLLDPAMDRPLFMSQNELIQALPTLYKITHSNMSASVKKKITDAFGKCFKQSFPNVHLLITTKKVEYSLALKNELSLFSDILSVNIESPFFDPEFYVGIIKRKHPDIYRYAL